MGQWLRNNGAATLVTVACVALVLGPALLAPTRLAVGGPVSEAPVHVWGLWSAARHLFEEGPFVRYAEAGWPEPFRSHLMDPINLLAFLPPYWLLGGGVRGAVAGWNFLHVAALGLGAWGIVRLVRQVVPNAGAGAAAVAVAAFCGTPFFLNTPMMGRSEYLPALLYPLHLALFHTWMRRPSASAPHGLLPPSTQQVGLLAGLSLGAVCLGGWYLSVFVGLMNIGIGLWWSRGLPIREAASRLLLVAAVGALVLSPAAHAFYQHPSPLRAMPYTEGWVPTALESSLSGRQAGLDELLRLAPRRANPVWNDIQPYLGLVTVLLAFAALRVAGARGWVLALFASLSLAMGPRWDFVYSVSAIESELPRGPVWWLAWLVPMLADLRAWGRMTAVVAVPAAVAAAWGFGVLTARLRTAAASTAAGLLLAGAMLWDQATWPVRIAVPAPTFSAEIPAGVAEAVSALSPGLIVMLPLQGQVDLGDTDETAAGRYLLWQLQHGSPISAAEPTRDEGLVPVSELMGAFRLWGAAAKLGQTPVVTARTTRCAEPWARDLRAKGVSALLLITGLGYGAHLEAPLRATLGAPEVDADGALGWDLAKRWPRGRELNPYSPCRSG